MAKKGRNTFNFRSKFESKVAESLDRRNVNYDYEALDLEYTLVKKYKTDFTLLANGIIIETKGVLTPEDRRKMRAVKEQHPELDIRFVFQRAKNKLNKNSKTTYAQWAERHGFLYAEKDVPDQWLLPKQQQKLL